MRNEERYPETNVNSHQLPLTTNQDSTKECKQLEYFNKTQKNRTRKKTERKKREKSHPHECTQGGMTK